MERTIFQFCLLAAIIGAGCSTQSRMVQTDLYFGLSKNDGTVIADSAWNLFVREKITAVFPEGFTVISAEGKWASEKDKKCIPKPRESSAT